MTTALGRARNFHFSRLLSSVLSIVSGANSDNHFSCNLEATQTDVSHKVTVPAAGFNQAFPASVSVSSMQVAISSIPVSSKHVTATCTPVDSYISVSVFSTRVSTPVSSIRMTTPVSSK